MLTMFVVLASCTICAVCLALLVMRRFLQYCKSVAVAEGRLAEFESREYEDEGGMNAFHREQFRRLMSGRLLNGNGADLDRQATKLRSQFLLLVICGFVLIASWVVLSRN